MGCDIHAHIEVKVNGKWGHYSCPLMKRCYSVFEKICGVRGDVAKAIAPPRGFPVDVSIITRLCYEGWHGYAHTPTWLSAEELDQLIQWAEKPSDQGGLGDDMFQHHQIGYLAGNMFGKDSRPEWAEDVRFICWFDN